MDHLIVEDGVQFCHKRINWETVLIFPKRRAKNPARTQTSPNYTTTFLPKGEDLRNAIKKLESRTYDTYLARIKAYERLTSRGNAWNATLIAFSTATTIASIGILSNPDMYGRGGEALMVALAVLSLVASLVVSNVNYGSRARAMEASYKRIQQISILAENLCVDEQGATRQRYLELRREYGIAIETSENHLTSDFLRSQKEKHGLTAEIRKKRKLLARDWLVTFTPYLTLIAPVALLIPFIIWLVRGL